MSATRQDDADQQPPPDEDDGCDVRLSLAGDGEAFARIVRRHQDAVGRLMWRFTRDRGRHSELVQDVFVQAYWSLGGYSGRSPLSHWLARIAVRTGYRFWRSQARHRAGSLDEAVPMADPGPTPAAALESAEAARQVHRLLARLPPRDRLVLTLLYLEGHEVREAARLTGWSATMVKVQAWRARSKLKRLLQETQQWT